MVQKRVTARNPPCGVKPLASGTGASSGAPLLTICQRTPIRRSALENASLLTAPCRGVQSALILLLRAPLPACIPRSPTSRCFEKRA